MRVVVCQDDGRGVEPDRIPEELAHAHNRGVEGPDVDRVDLDDVVLAVEDHHRHQLSKSRFVR